jgi:glycerol-3-phosphate cytidylyltransferase
MEKIEIIKSLKYVTEVFLEKSLELKREYLLKYQADILVMSDDWESKFDEFKDIEDVVYLPRTPSISTTELIEKIK